MALPIGMWQVGFAFAALGSLYLTQSRRVLWAIPTLLAWILVAYTSTNVAVVDGGVTTTFESLGFAYTAAFMAVFTFVQLILYGLLARRDPDPSGDPSPGDAVGSVSEHLEESI